MFNRHLLLLVLIFSSLGLFAQANRTYDGSLNNVNNPNWGAVGDVLVRSSTVAYGDSISTPAGQNRPNPRTISNELFAQTGLVDDPLSLSNFIWVWGQFVDHDISLTHDNQTEFSMISIPQGDPVFDPTSTGIMVIPMKRSDSDPNSGTSPSNPRQHKNDITAFLDASNVYGSDQTRADWLRTFNQGKLKTSSGGLLPFNTTTSEFGDQVDSNAPNMDDAVGISPNIFVAGDFRANENILLTSFHTLFVREHNRLCNEVYLDDPTLTDEQIYQKVRKIVGGLINAIIYEEWLPSMGVTIPAYSGYDPTVHPGIMNIFAGAAFRMGHSLLTSDIPRLDNDGNPIPEGNILLRDAFFNPLRIIDEGGIDPLFKGMAQQTQQNFDCQVIDDVRNFLFGEPGSGGLDLASININRGRERGFADYNTIRTDFGLAPVNSFIEINSNPTIAADLATVYSDVNSIDAWVGMLSEEHLPNSLFGPLVNKIMEIQFTNLRDGDRFYYENDPGLTQEEKAEIKSTKLVDIILRNTGISLMQGNLFTAMSHDTLVACGAIIPNADISGTFSSSNGTPVSNVDLEFTNTLNGNIQNFAGVNGDYSFDNIPTCYGYKIHPYKNDNHRNGVSTYDIVVIQNHILGIASMNSPLKILAADVNGSNTITTGDIVAIRQMILHIIDEFPLVDSWKFIPANFSFTDPNQPFLDNIPNYIEINNLVTNGIFNFSAIKMGDVNGSAIANATGGSQGRSFDDSFVFEVDDQIISKEKEIKINFTAKDLSEMQAFQFTLDFDESLISYKGFEAGALQNFSIGNIGVFEEQGMITTSWNGSSDLNPSDIIFSLTFKGQGSGSLVDALSVSSRMTAKEAYRNNGEALDVDLMFNGDQGTVLLSEQFTLMQNYPNPFTTDTKIAFSIPAASKVSIVVSDILGELIKTVEMEANKGYNEFIISSTDLKAAGVYNYEIISDFGQVSKKMILID